MTTTTVYGDAQDYVERATSFALGGATHGISRHGGTLVSSASRQDDRGHWLEVRGTLDDLPGVEVRYARLLLPADGPDKAPETEGTIYSSGFEERVHTRARCIVPVEGVITL